MSKRETPERRTRVKSGIAVTALEAPRGEDPFALPRSVMHHIRKCVESQEDASTGHRDTVRYLWMHVAADDSAGMGSGGRRELGLPEWLSIVDEAAALGVECLAICVGESPGCCPHVWKICQWAQRAHGMHVGLHMYGKTLAPADIAELKRLSGELTCFFVSESNTEAMCQLERHGIRRCSSDVSPEDHCPPCDMPREMVFVGPEGTMYTCGLVLGNDEFRLGDVLREPIEKTLGRCRGPRRVPQWVPHGEHGCDACPPIMARRVLGDGGQ